MTKLIVTLERGPNREVDFPESYRVGSEVRTVERSCFGSIRLFQGIPRAMSASEVEFVRTRLPAVYAELRIAPYVESRRLDKRGVSEADLSRLAIEEGISHLPVHKKLTILRERGRIPVPTAQPEDSEPED